MRKREKVAYILGIAAATALFTWVIPPTPQPPVEVEADTLVVEPIEPVFRISPYDSLFREYADTLGWDWKLLAAVAYVESKFDTAAVSSVGARGLMQMMPQSLYAANVPDSKKYDYAKNEKIAKKIAASSLTIRTQNAERYIGIHFSFSKK